MEYHQGANVFDMNQCLTPVVLGCTDSTVRIANTDDGSCYPVILGCMDRTAFNYIELSGDLVLMLILTPQKINIYGCLDLPKNIMQW